MDLDFLDIPAKELSANNLLIFSRQGLDIHGKRAIAIAMSKVAIGKVTSADVTISRADFAKIYLMDSTKSQNSFAKALINLDEAKLTIIENGTEIYTYKWVISVRHEIKNGIVETQKFTLNPQLLEHLTKAEDRTFTRYPLAWSMAFGKSVKRWQFFEMLFSAGRKQWKKQKTLTVNSDDLSKIFGVNGWWIFNEKIYKPALPELARLGVTMHDPDLDDRVDHGKVEKVKFKFEFEKEGPADIFHENAKKQKAPMTKEEFAAAELEKSENPEIAKTGKIARALIREQKNNITESAKQPSTRKFRLS